MVARANVEVEVDLAFIGSFVDQGSLRVNGVSLSRFQTTTDSRLRQQDLHDHDDFLNILSYTISRGNIEMVRIILKYDGLQPKRG